jgi:hypothetical protein
VSKTVNSRSLKGVPLLKVGKPPTKGIRSALSRGMGGSAAAESRRACEGWARRELVIAAVRMQERRRMRRLLYA